MEILEELKDLNTNNTWMKAELAHLCYRQTKSIDQVNNNMKYIKDLGCCVVNTAIMLEDVLETLEVMNKLELMLQLAGHQLPRNEGVQEGSPRTFYWDIAAGKKKNGKGKEKAVESEIEDNAQGEVEGLGEEEDE
jgi:hypothetical protein